jgi:hypothetical protein
VRILEEYPERPILLVTLYLTHQLTEEAHTAGIRGTLSKTAMDHLEDGIEALLRGEYLACPDGRAVAHPV